MNNLLAALIFFTRLPFWRIKTVPSECFRHVVSYWSLAGWLTGGVMALVFFLAAWVFPLEAAVILALASRLLVTGALHEDGLADFFDGFGGGRDRESILRIMKDSHIGSYGVLGLIVYYLMAYTLLTSLPPEHIPFVLLCGDAFSKCVGSFVIKLLPYARKEKDSKAKVIYTPMTVGECVASILGGAIPLVFLPSFYGWALLCPVVCFFLLVSLFKYRLGGYTGDCCGALFLLCELGFWAGVVMVSRHLPFVMHLL